MGLDTSTYLKAVGDSHRKALGQFFTPPTVASFMVRWILESGVDGVHDPSFGMGAFLDAMPEVTQGSFTASEVDPKILGYWYDNAPCNNSRVLVREEDYLLSWGREFGNIVCNPPYMRFQKFLNRKIVFQEFEDHLNLRLPGYTNTASTFLLKSLFELQKCGRLAYIMPLEFLNTGYGKLVKERLIADSHLTAIISLESEREVFPDATTTAGIILYDSGRRYSHTRFFKANSLESLDSILASTPTAEVPHDQITPEDNWLLYFDDSPTIFNRAKTVPLSHYGRFSRGIATGANIFFSLRPSKVRELGLKASEVAPIITRSAQVNTPIFTDADYDELVNRDEPVLLFDVNEQGSEAAKAYIHYGELEEFDQRFLTRNRTPWYKTENRKPSPLLIGVFSRGGYKVVRNKASVLNLTCFHGFQPNVLGSRYLDLLFLYLCSATGREIASLSMRRYGDGLDKFEPNDLNKSLVPSQLIFDEISLKDIEAALIHLEERGTIPEFMESWFKNGLECST